MIEKKEKLESPWLLKAVFLVGFIILALISFAIFKENYRKKQVENEIRVLQAQVEKIQKDNINLYDKISYLGSADYQEKEAKDKLNLQRPEENTIIIKPSQASKKEIEENENAQKEILVKISNSEKWWNYFFKY